MAHPAIRVEGISKRYAIGGPRLPYRTLRESLVEAGKGAGRLLAGRLPRRGPEEFWALRDVTFDVAPGEVIGLIGRNGAGKSTLLKILSRITEPTAGRVVLCGRVASLLEVGTGFHPELTGRENILLSGTILGMRRAEIARKFDAIVAFAEVESFIETPVKRYSSGMSLRLAFAVAAHLEPEILLVDEVLAVGDVTFQKKCLGKMDEVAREGRTVIFVSHNMPAVERLCGRGVLLEQGRVAALGPMPQVIAGYLQSGMRGLGERVWESPSAAPGDDVVRLKAVRAIGADGIVGDTFKITEPLQVDLEFWVMKPGATLDASFYFSNESGALIFATYDFQDPRWRDRPRPVGVHRSSCHIPAHLLNEGTITVLSGVSTNPHTLHAIEPHALTLRLVDDMQPSGARCTYTREWPGGAVRPLLTWTFGYTPLPQGAGEILEAAVTRP